MKTKISTQKIVFAALMAALCYIGFSYFRIDIPVGTEKTAFHLGNVFCVLAALLIGGFWGGMSGAIGMTIADLTTGYVPSAPKTFIQKLCIGQKEIDQMKGKRVLIIDDVISTGGSLKSIELLVEKAGGNVVGKMAVLAEGDAADRDDIIFLEKLPLFNEDGTVK